MSGLRHERSFHNRSFREPPKMARAIHPRTGSTLQIPSAVDSRVGWRLLSEGKGHTFESCRARQCLFVLQDDVPPAQLDRSCEILIRAGVIAPEISGLAAQNTRDRRTRACLPSASASASRSPPERASAFGLLTGAGIRGQPLEPFR